MHGPIAPPNSQNRGWNAAGWGKMPIGSTMSDDTSNRHSLITGPDFVIVGPLRAGTTLFRLILGNHPGIHDIGEFEESVAMLSDQGYPSPKSYRDWLAVHRVAQARNYPFPASPDSYQEITHAMWTHNAAQAPEGSVIGCTIHSRIDRILDL